MTTAARPTFDPARGKGSQAPTRIYSSRDLASHTKLKFRQAGQTTQDELNRLDLKLQLQKAEQDHYQKVNKTTKLASGLSNSFKDNDDDEDEVANGTASAAIEESPLERKKRLLKEAERLDKDDSDSDDSDSKDSDDSDDSDSDDDDDEDDTAELLRELEKIKRERAEEKERQERLQREEEEKEREAQVAAGNPLLNMPDASSSAPKDFSVKRRWDDDVVFKNQARGMDDKPKKRFINDTLRSDFHRKFMSKYVQ
ncbi:hypothetical protein BGZ93_005004 [Podila epicladia]|nr:hypothetical protein BGZ92_011944 [Podila epicladia]KAG0096091.1 hypothetical protein BGZ93_005004 [Podila epicladia]